jgi:hypothetical protein
MKVVRISPIRTGRLYHQEIFLVLVFVSGRLDPRAIGNGTHDNPPCSTVPRRTASPRTAEVPDMHVQELKWRKVVVTQSQVMSPHLLVGLRKIKDGRPSVRDLNMWPPSQAAPCCPVELDFRPITTTHNCFCIRLIRQVNHLRKQHNALTNIPLSTAQ